MPPMYLAEVMMNSGGRQLMITQKSAVKNPQKGGEKTRRRDSQEKRGFKGACETSAPSRASKKFPIVQKKVVLAKK